MHFRFCKANIRCHSSGIHHAPLDIKMNHIILIQMFFKGLRLMNRIVRKQFSGITA